MNLALATTDDILAELKSRYPVMAFVASTHFTDTCDLDVASCNGRVSQVNFMLDILKRNLVDNYMDDAEDLEGPP